MQAVITSYSIHYTKLYDHLNTLWNIERGLVSPMGVHIHRVYRALGVSVVTPSPETLILE